MRCLTFFLVITLWLTPSFAAEKVADEVVQESKPTRYTVAVIPFQGRGAVSEQALNFSDLLYAELADKPSLKLVEREAIDRIFEEQGLSKAGFVSEQDAVQVAAAVGAQFMIFGRAFSVGDGHTDVVARVVSVETTKMHALRESFEKNSEMAARATKLSDAIDETLRTKAKELLPKPEGKSDVLEDLRAILEGQRLPGVYVKVEEQHLSRSAVDPASDVELKRIFKRLGFKVYDESPRATEKKDRADLIIHGEAFSDFAAKRGELFACVGRVEIEVIDPSVDQILAADHEQKRRVDVSEMLAGKNAILDATQAIALRLIPEFVRNWNKSRTETPVKKE